MRILTIQVDKTQDKYVSDGVEVYLKRLRGYVQHEILTINVPKNVRQRSISEQKGAEADLLLRAVGRDDFLALLDEQGTEFSSTEFASFIAKRQNASVKRLVFMMGGPYGFDRRVYDRADVKLSLSRMTFSHQMVRLFFVEQLYRAFTILKGEKYHH